MRSNWTLPQHYFLFPYCFRRLVTSNQHKCFRATSVKSKLIESNVCLWEFLRYTYSYNAALLRARVAEYHSYFIFRCNYCTQIHTHLSIGLLLSLASLLFLHYIILVQKLKKWFHWLNFAYSKAWFEQNRTGNRMHSKQAKLDPTQYRCQNFWFFLGKLIGSLLRTTRPVIIARR